MPVCGITKQKPQYDFNKKVVTVDEKAAGDKFNKELVKVSPTIDPCVEDIIKRGEMKHMFTKWDKLKRIRDMYDEQVTLKRAECFRDKILKHMKKRIASMPHNERKLWLTKLIRLAFLNKLKQIKELRTKRRSAFMDQLENARDDERDFLLSKLEELKDMYEIKEIDDVNQVLAMKEASRAFQTKKAKQLEMRIRLNRLKKLEEFKKKEEKKLREERVDKIKEVIVTKKNWLEEMIKKIEDITNNLADDIANLSDKQNWYDSLQQELKDTRNQLIEDEELRLQREQSLLNLMKEREQAQLKKEQKMKEIATWEKERKLRLWKLEKIKQFDDFLEDRYKAAEGDENLFFKKIFKKLTASQKKTVEVDPWAMKPKLDERQKELAIRKRHNQWVNSIVSSNRNKVVTKVKLKKFLEVMDTPQYDRLTGSISRVGSIKHTMTVVRGRIFRNNFPDNKKHYIAKVFNLIVFKAKLDIRDIDPTDDLQCIHLSTKKQELYLSSGNEFLIIMDQTIPVAEEPCQGKADVLCITKEERDKMLELIKKRQESRKVIKDRRLEEYEAFLNRKAVDDAWMIYMKKAYEEAINDLGTCKKDNEEGVKIEVAEKPVPTDAISVSNQGRMEGGYALIPGLTEQQLKSLVVSDKGKAFKLPPHAASIRPRLSYNKAMDKRVERLNNAVLGVDDTLQDTPYYFNQTTNVKSLLRQEKVLRDHMVKNMPGEQKDDY